MKAQSLSTLVALASGINVVTATGWLDASAFKCPTNIDNRCNTQQNTGFDWNGLASGPFQKYGGFNFDKWSCADSFGGNSKRTFGSKKSPFQSKCITAEAHNDRSKCPSFGHSDSGFSVDSFQVSVEFDCHLDFHYNMPDGSTCKQRSSCKKGGSTIKNTQCGGAKDVTVVYPGGGPKKTCKVGVHSIGFDCKSHTTKTYSATPTPKKTKTKSVPSYPTVTVPSYPTTTPSYPTESVPETEVVPSYTASESGPESVPTYAPTESAPESVPTYAPTESAPESVPTYAPTESAPESVPTYAPSESAPESVPTYAPTESTPSYPTGVVPPPYHGSNTTAAPGVPTYVPSESQVIPSEVPTSTAEGTVSVPEESTTPLPYPSILPQCLNTWVPMGSDCSSNAAADCYCSSETVICSVYECLYAHGATDSEIAQAQDYLKGICVNQIGSNPALLSCTNEVEGPTTYPVGPVTTVTVVHTTVVPCSESGVEIPYSSTTTTYTTAVVVPQVVLTTVPGPASTVALVTGTPAPAPTYPAAEVTVPGVPGAAAATTFAQVTYPASNSTGVAPPPFTNSASQTGLGFSSFMAAAIFIAAFAL